MLQFTKPTELNGEQLIAELNDAGIKTNRIPLVDGNDNLWLDVAEKDKSKAETIVNAHVGIDASITKATAKAVLLERLGITEDEARLLLG
jgi:hypothetical protein